MKQLVIENEHVRGEKIHSPGVPQNAVLEGFRFGFGNGGHKLKKIGVLREDNHLRINFEDNDGNDPIKYLFRYRVIKENFIFHRQTFTGSGKETAEIDLESPRGTVPVLQGFLLTFEDGEDHEITEISLNLGSRPHSEDKIKIVFRDHGDKDAIFQFVVQVIWIGLGTVVDAFELADFLSHGRATNRRGPAALRGFHFRYVRGNNGEDDKHYIAEIFGDLGQGHTPSDNSIIRIHDGDNDDKSRKHLIFALLDSV